MFQIAAGVCLGILGAVAVLNLWRRWQERRLQRLADRFANPEPKQEPDYTLRLAVGVLATMIGLGLLLGQR